VKKLDQVYVPIPRSHAKHLAGEGGTSFNLDDLADACRAALAADRAGKRGGRARPSPHLFHDGEFVTRSVRDILLDGSYVAHPEAVKQEWIDATFRLYHEVNALRSFIVSELVGDQVVAVNVCEHGDHAAPEGRRFCSRACEECEHAEGGDPDSGCAGLCGRPECPGAAA